MIRVCHSARSGVSLEGEQHELQALRAEIVALTDSGKGSLSFDCGTTGSPHPYAKWLNRLFITLGEGPTRVAVVGTELHVTGDRTCLEGFASVFRFQPDAHDGMHAHYEWWEGHKWIAKDSIPLVVMVRRPGAS